MAILTLLKILKATEQKEEPQKKEKQSENQRIFIEYSRKSYKHSITQNLEAFNYF